MIDIEPLYISIGQPADGKYKFFPRDKVVNEIWQRLKAGEDLLLTAPRRVGKSSILHYIKKNPHDGYIVKYIPIMGVSKSNAYFKLIYDTLLENNEIYSPINGTWEKIKSNTKNFFKKIRSIGSMGELKFDGKNQLDYYAETKKLLKSFPKESKRVVFLLDEFPETVSNIAQHGKEKAIKFLQDNRDLRQLNHDADIQFIITGSIGLGNVVKRLTNDNHLINDLKLVEISALDNTEASLMIDRLCLGLIEDEKELIFLDEVKSHLFEKIIENVPYYIMMIIDELSKEVSDAQKEITNNDIDEVIDKIVKSRANADYFSNWKTRLGDAFTEQNEKVAIKILNHISKHNTMSHKEMKTIDKKIDLNAIIEVLEYDGYISEHNEQYSFNSPLLKSWWSHRVAK